ncbi:hypothetical protein BD324DRAFT_679024 [Kockovaella imperatae]|uniref:SET domain-containing protein n=1 Tax=Kockovaella imperatae TaxID=4999 RepID=A0A1Y1UPQ4_9TREE|nr:hypothetical protein BD324DRAFT_679024 [Kockovaella imperatae]ORX39952.1 hypothetical protein BD324DRAFT_679024 [Kockovaella imperatae]
MSDALAGLKSIRDYGSDGEEDRLESDGLVEIPKSSHGLFTTEPPPSPDTLWHWLRAQGIEVSDHVKVKESETSGWGLLATDDLAEFHVLCRIPKTAILSLRTTSLKLPTSTPTYDPRSTHSVWFLALALLHEFRLGRESRFYEYIQSLPRDTLRLPICWDVKELCGRDGQVALEILRGSDVDRSLRRQRIRGKGLTDLESFYELYAKLLPPTASHPARSPFIDYIHCFCLVSSRAFVIDVYHTLALCPFADLLNHSESSHTSLSSDDFVCGTCGSLRTCSHDRFNTSGRPYRLDHLSGNAIRRLHEEVDTVDLLVEVPMVHLGEEIFNSYGPSLSSSQLLTEWGYLDAERHGLIHFDLEDIGGSPQLHGICLSVLAYLAEPDASEHCGSEYIRFPSLDPPGLMGVHRQSGKITQAMWSQVYMSVSPADAVKVDPTSICKESLLSRSLSVWGDQEGIKEHQQTTSVTCKMAIRRVIGILNARLQGMSRSEKMSPVGPLSRMARKYVEGEERELKLAVEKWKSLPASWTE